jgi:lipopolysaccharide/colanic/teichoic acid biosynthesis glycosyltransferase
VIPPHPASTAQRSWQGEGPFAEARPEASGRSTSYDRTKRLFDIVVGSVALAVASPLLILIAAAIWLESPGPILFRDRRYGQHGQRFTFYKFRTMQWTEESRRRSMEAGALVTRESGYRKPTSAGEATRIGMWLRRSSVDEVPNLLNVVLGDMSLVGPRPIGWSMESLGDAAPELLSVKPGVTGLWQVMGRGDLSFAERVALDVEYVRRRSVRFDLWILLKTIPAVLSCRGAY